MLFFKPTGLLLALPLSFAATLPQHGAVEALRPALVERQASTSTKVPDGACTNSPSTRNCWNNGYSVSTDFDKKFPPSGKTVTVSLFSLPLGARSYRKYSTI